MLFMLVKTILIPRCIITKIFQFTKKKVPSVLQRKMNNENGILHWITLPCLWGTWTGLDQRAALGRDRAGRMQMLIFSSSHLTIPSANFNCWLYNSNLMILETAPTSFSTHFSWWFVIINQSQLSAKRWELFAMLSPDRLSWELGEGWGSQKVGFAEVSNGEREKQKVELSKEGKKVKKKKKKATVIFSAVN